MKGRYLRALLLVRRSNLEACQRVMSKRVMSMGNEDWTIRYLAVAP